MNQITVDVIIATYNRTGSLVEALDSVQSQRFSNWQCWIAEDGETQEKLETVKPYLKDNRFKYVPGEHAGFPATPRNRAIRRGKGKYVAILDDDDLWLPEKLERQVKFLENHPHCVLLGCNALRWTGKGEWDKNSLYFKKYKEGRINYETMLSQNYIVHSSAILRRTALGQAGLYNEALDPPIGEDYELWLRVGALGEIWALAESCIVYRETPLTYYTTLNRCQKYEAMANIFESSLNGISGIPSPLSYPENARLAEACKRQRDFYLRGPRFLGRFRHELASTLKTIFKPLQEKRA
jgi:glycosyltransferase involved in cell wall biosynthesis